MREASLRLSYRVMALLAAAFVSACRSDSIADSGGGPGGGMPAIDVPAFPLRAAESARYLVDQRGVPFLVNGDTPWSLTHNLSYDEAVRYMENRRAQGINALIVSVPDAFDPNGSASYPPDRQGNRPFLGDDVTRPSEPYWQHVDRVLAKTEELGFLVFFFPAYLGCCNDGYVALFRANGVARSQAYGRFVGQRYGARKNLVWVHGGDLNPDSARDVVAAIKAGIREVDASHSHTTHWAPETDPYAPFGDEFTDIHTTYTYQPVSALVWKHYAHEPRKPVILIETHYENDWAGKPVSEVRKYPYRALLSGAAGHFFGNKPLWFCGYGWESALDSPGSRAMGLVGRLFRSRPWQLLVPDRQGRLVTAGGGDPARDDGVQAARATDGSFAMAFVPDRRDVQVDLGQISGPLVRVYWFDIVNGSMVVAGDFSAPGLQRFTAPWGDGSVLVIDDAARGYPAPGGPGN